MKNIDGYNLTASIHTIAVRSSGIVRDIGEDIADCILPSSRTKDGDETTSIINVNKYDGDVFTYSRFQEVLEAILEKAGIDDYKIIRADLRLDSYDPKHYETYNKLNKYLISALATSYSVRNCYRATDLFSQKQLSIAIKNRYFECENYDKAAESGGMDAASSRLELRGKSLINNDLNYEFTNRWFRRWDNAVSNLELVHQRYNDVLERLYLEDQIAYPKRFRSLTDFLIQYQDCIFCKVQMIDLLSRLPEIGAERARNRAENHKKRYGIEYFSQKDVQYALAEIRRATLAFFEK